LAEKRKSKKSHKSSKKHSHPHKRRKKPKAKSNLLMGVVVFVVLVAIIYGVIVLLGKAGDMRSDVAATVNDEPITMAQLDEQYDRIPAEYRAFITKTTLLNQTINEVVLLQEANKAGITVTQEQVDNQIVEAMSQAGVSEDELDEKLAEQNLTKEFLNELYKKQLTINELLEDKVFVKMKVSESEIKEHYDSKIRAAHILVEDKDDAEKMIIDLQRTSSSLVNQVFFDLAEENSIDPSAKTGKGDLGEFSKGMMVPEFEKVAMDLEIGEFTTDPVKTQFGYHVILRLAKEKTLEEQSSEIEDFLLLQKKSSAVPLYVAKLVKKADVQIFYEDPAPEAEE